MTSNSQKQYGFSLIEVLITVIILAGASIALTKFQAILMLGSSDARNRTEAVYLAQSLMDKYRNTFQTSNITSTAATTVTGKSAVFTVSGTVTNTAIVTGETLSPTPTPPATPAPVPVPKIVTATVTWVNAQNETQSVNLSSIMRFNSQQFKAP